MLILWQGSQEQVQREVGVSQQESLELVRCLLRVSINHLSYLRGLFPEENFKGVSMKNLEGMHMKMLVASSSEEAKRLTEWVENGVYHALKKGYLKTVLFGICNDEEGLDLIEEYIFSFSYSSNGEVEMGLVADMKNKRTDLFQNKKRKKPVEMSQLKYQVCRLMRHLVSICQTLDKVPEERFLFMKLMYHDHTPDDYEPPHFVPYPAEKKGRFKHKPFTMHVGSVKTDNHEVSLNVKTMLDYTPHDEAESDDETVNDENVVVEEEHSQQHQHCESEGEDMQSCGSIDLPDQDNEISSAPNEPQMQEYLSQRTKPSRELEIQHEEERDDEDVMLVDDPVDQADMQPPVFIRTQTTREGETTVEQSYRTRPPKTDQNRRERGGHPKPGNLFITCSQLDFEEKHPEELHDIEAYLMGKSKVSITDAFDEFLNIPVDIIRECFEHLVHRGVLQSTDSGNKFVVVNKTPPGRFQEFAPADEPSVGENAENDPFEYCQKSQSQEGLIKSNGAGSARTMSLIKTHQSKAGNGNRDACGPPPEAFRSPLREAPLGRSQANNNPPINCKGSQNTDHKYKARKASFVANPIAKKRRLGRIAKMQTTKGNSQQNEE
ncbi:hypothetical protein BSKO_03225 [Bryopsis sp. KO-2023]|nr:hypothetical protein BSKO_03225 [Bryopsis sp. KO-2023]